MPTLDELKVLLAKRMAAKNCGDLTIKQRQQDIARFFGNPPTFENARKKIEEKKEDHLKSNTANKIASVLNNLPELQPAKGVMDVFRKFQKELNEKRLEYYAKKTNTKPEGAYDSLRKAMGVLEEKRGKNEQELQDLLLMQFYIGLNDYIGRGVEFRQLKLRKDDGTGNYIQGSVLYLNEYKKGAYQKDDGTYDKLKDGQMEVEVPKVIMKTVTALRRLRPGVSYAFGGVAPMSQSAFSKYQKRVMGYSTNDLRKIMIQQREGVSEEMWRKMQETAKKANHTLDTQRGHYV